MKKELKDVSEIIRKRLESNSKEVVFICIGSSKIIGDSIGPKVGSLLKKQSKFKDTKIFGDMQKPVTAKNISEIKEKLKDKFTIVIDSAIGKKEAVGNIYISNSKTKLGKALDKNVAEIGDISIKACVCENLYNTIKNYYELNKVDINLITKLTNQIVNIICLVNE